MCHLPIFLPILNLKSGGARVPRVGTGFFQLQCHDEHGSAAAACREEWLTHAFYDFILKKV